MLNLLCVCVCVRVHGRSVEISEIFRTIFHVVQMPINLSIWIKILSAIFYIESPIDAIDDIWLMHF